MTAANVIRKQNACLDVNLTLQDNAALSFVILFVCNFSYFPGAHLHVRSAFSIVLLQCVSFLRPLKIAR
jgi:hypothetical protein